MISTSTSEECGEADYRSYQVYLPCRVENTAVVAMADTGNQWRSALSWDAAKRIGIQLKDIKPIPGYNKIGTAAVDGELEVMGETRHKLRINLGGGTRDILCKPVVIKNLSMPFNLSGPFMKRHQIDILHTGDALVQGRKIPMQARSGNFNQMASAYTLVYTTEDAVIEPHKPTYISAVAKAVKDGSMKADSLLVVGDGAFTERYDLHPLTNAFLKCDEEGAMDVVALNSTDRPIRVKKGSIYGIGFQTTDVTNYHREPWKICVLENVNNPDADQTSTGKIPKMNKEEPTKSTKEDEKWKLEHNIPPDFDASLEKYIHDGETLPRFMRGPTTHKNMKMRVAFLLRYFKLHNNKFLADRNNLNATLALLLKYFDVWAFDGNFGQTHLMKHHINLEPGTRPIHEKYRPPNPLLEESLKKQLDVWLRHKVIEKSNSPWNFSLVAAIKKGGKIRWCTDWRALVRNSRNFGGIPRFRKLLKLTKLKKIPLIQNRATVKDRHPIGSCDSNLARLGKSRIFSTLDAMGAFRKSNTGSDKR